VLLCPRVMNSVPTPPVDKENSLNEPHAAKLNTLKLTSKKQNPHHTPPPNYRTQLSIAVKKEDEANAAGGDNAVGLYKLDPVCTAP
jgi:hypothetical protein